MPLYSLAQAVWYSMVGFGLMHSAIPFSRLGTGGYVGVVSGSS